MESLTAFVLMATNHHSMKTRQQLCEHAKLSLYPCRMSTNFAVSNEADGDDPVNDVVPCVSGQMRVCVCMVVCQSHVGGRSE